MSDGGGLGYTFRYPTFGRLYRVPCKQTSSANSEFVSMTNLKPPIRWISPACLLIRPRIEINIPRLQSPKTGSATSVVPEEHNPISSSSIPHLRQLSEHPHPIPARTHSHVQDLFDISISVPRTNKQLVAIHHSKLTWYRNTRNTRSSRKQASRCNIGILMQNLCEPSQKRYSCGRKTFLSRKEIIDDCRQCLVDHGFHWHMCHTLDKY